MHAGDGEWQRPPTSGEIAADWRVPLGDTSYRPHFRDVARSQTTSWLFRPHASRRRPSGREDRCNQPINRRKPSRVDSGCGRSRCPRASRSDHRWRSPVRQSSEKANSVDLVVVPWRTRSGVRLGPGIPSRAGPVLAVRWRASCRPARIRRNRNRLMPERRAADRRLTRRCAWYRRSFRESRERQATRRSEIEQVRAALARPVVQARASWACLTSPAVHCWPWRAILLASSLDRGSCRAALIARQPAMGIRTARPVAKRSRSPQPDG